MILYSSTVMHYYTLWYIMEHVSKKVDRILKYMCQKLRSPEDHLFTQRTKFYSY